MADFSTSLNSKMRELLAKYDGAEGTTTSTHITTSGGDSASVELSMGVSVGEDDAQAGISASVEAETDGTTVFATGDTAASGETASTSLDVNAELEGESAVVEVIATSEATGDEADITATANTDAAASPESEILHFQQETIETSDGDSLTAESYTYLEATWSDQSLALESQAGMEESVLIDMGDVDWLF